METKTNKCGKCGHIAYEGYDYCVDCIIEIVCKSFGVLDGDYEKMEEITLSLIGRRTGTWTEDYDLLCILRETPAKIYCILGENIEM